jgi:hypothetical protein
MEPSTTGWAESEQKDDQAVEMKRPMTDFDGVDGVMWVVSFRPRLLTGGRRCILTGRIRARSEGGFPDDLTPPFGSTGGISRAFDLDLLQCLTRTVIRMRVSLPAQQPYRT